MSSMYLVRSDVSPQSGMLFDPTCSRVSSGLLSNDEHTWRRSMPKSEHMRNHRVAFCLAHAALGLPACHPSNWFSG